MVAGQPTIVTIFQKVIKANMLKAQPKTVENYNENDDLPVGWRQDELDRMYRLKRVEMLQRGWKSTSIKPSGRSVVVNDLQLNSKSKEVQVLAETSVLPVAIQSDASTISDIGASGASCTDKVGSGLSRVSGLQTDQTVLSFSSPRSRKNIYTNKSVQSLISFHAKAFVSRERGSPRKGIGNIILTPPKKRGLEGDSSVEQFKDSDLSKSPGRQPIESPAKRLRKNNISAAAE